MMLKKMIVLATLLIGMTFFVNMTLGNVDNIGLVSDQSRSYIDENDDETHNYSNTDYIVVKGEDGGFYLTTLSFLENRTVDSIEDHETESTSIPFLEHEDSEDIKRFSSFEELKGYVQNHTTTYQYYWNEPWIRGDIFFEEPMVVTFNDMSIDSGSVVSSKTGYSTTNNQVYGVDEGDIIKNDGRFAYIVSKNRNSVIITDVFPPTDAGIISMINTTGSIREIYINDDTLVVLGRRLVYLMDPLPISFDTNGFSKDLDYKYIQLETGTYYYFNYISYTATFIETYDVKNKEMPRLLNTHLWRGSLVQSRMINNHVYLITTQSVNSNVQEWDLPVPSSEIYRFNVSNFTLVSNYYLSLTTIMSINISDSGSSPNAKTILMKSSNHIYVSLDNIYITDRNYFNNNENTSIHRIAIHNGEISYKAKGEVPGYVLNRFSMDEYQGYFRIATTIGFSSSSGVYVLDMDMNIVGKLEGIAPNERMYSARFMGHRAYLVTFRRMDPFFVINLTDPTAPEMMGELVIPGWSDYLHPYDENHVIGLGRETTSMGWTEGVKLSLFDVTDVKNPKEVSKFVIGDSSSRTLATSDPHAFQFNKEKNLLVIPVKLNYTWSAAYVFNISLEKGFELRDTISHPSDNDDQSGYKWYYNYDGEIKRSFIINNTLYTLSNSYLKMNDLDDLRDINILELPTEGVNEPGLPVMCIEIGPISR